MKRIFAGSTLLVATGLGMAIPAHAADNVMKECGAKYQAAKASKTLPAGQTWAQYLAQCRGTKTTASPAPVAAAKPVAQFPRRSRRAGGEGERRLASTGRAEPGDGRDA